MVDSVVSSSLLLGQGISLGDKTITLIPQELPDFVKPGMVFKVNSLLNLELITNNNLFRMELQNTDGEKFFVDVKLSEGVKPKVLENNISNYNVKVQAEKVLQLVSNKITSTAVKQEMSVLTEDSVVKLDNFSKQSVELPILKASQIVEKIMSEINFPPDIKTQIMKNVEFIDVIPIVKNIGTSIEFDDTVLMPIRNTLRKLMQENVGTEQFAKLECQLVNNIKNLDGSLFPIRNIPHGNQEQLMVFDTPLGKILHNMLVKVSNDIPLQMEVKIADNFLQNEVGVKLKAVVEFLKDKMPQNIERETKIGDILKILSKPNEVVKPLVKLVEPLIKNVAYQPMAEIIATKIPGMKPDLLSNLYSFYKASQSRDIRDWLGGDIYNKIVSLPKSNEILSNIESVLISSVKDTPTWRVVEVPFFDGAQIFSWKLSVARDRKDEKNKFKSKSGIRFVVDTEFTSLGAFQFDGFSSAKERRLDLIIRTSKHQSEDFCSQIINLFKKSLYDVDYVGTIKINLKADFIKTYEENMPSREGVYI